MEYINIGDNKEFATIGIAGARVVLGIITLFLCHLIALQLLPLK